MANNKASEILSAARRLMMEQGYNGFSFRDVAAEVGIKSASIHYHFPTKAELAKAVAKDYREWCAGELEGLSATDAPGLLLEYGDLFVAMLQDRGSVCLGGVLAIDASTLPTQVREQVTLFFDAHHAWVGSVLRKGQRKGEIRNEIDADRFAETLVSSIEGAMIVARGIGRPDHLSKTIAQLIRLVKS